VPVAWHASSSASRSASRVSPMLLTLLLLSCFGSRFSLFAAFSARFALFVMMAFLKPGETVGHMRLRGGGWEAEVEDSDSKGVDI